MFKDANYSPSENFKDCFETIHRVLKYKHRFYGYISWGKWTPILTSKSSPDVDEFPERLTGRLGVRSVGLL